MAIITGDQNDNVLNGWYEDDVLRGLGGNDTLFGGYGNDVLEGGTGNDLLIGAEGNNTYLFSRGDGQDRIQSWSDKIDKHDTIRFSDGIDPSDIVIERQADSLILRIKGTTDSITVDYYFMRNWNSNGPVSPHGIEEIRFFDGTGWSRETILTMLKPVAELGPMDDWSYERSADGKGGNDFLVGSYDDDVLRGGDGKDTLMGREGDDFLDGGAGDDLLDGGSGFNTIRFARGGGHDTVANQYNVPSTTIVDLRDALQGSLAYTRSNGGSGPDLVISYRDSGDSITFQGFFDPSVPEAAKALRLQFADNTLLTNWEILQLMNKPAGVTLTGTEGNDFLGGGYADDTCVASAATTRCSGPTARICLTAARATTCSMAATATTC